MAKSDASRLHSLLKDHAIGSTHSSCYEVHGGDAFSLSGEG